MVSPGDEYSPAHGNGQTTRKDLGDHVFLSPPAIRQGMARKGVINPSRDGAEVASGMLSWQELSCIAVLRGAETSKQLQTGCRHPEPVCGWLWFGFLSSCPPHNTTRFLDYSGHILLGLSVLPS